MKTVELPTNTLLAKIKSNREAHRVEYEEAVKNYREEAIDKLKEALKAAKDGGEIVTYFKLIPPVSKLGEYDEVIAMLEMTTVTMVELDHHEFACYVLDKWEWRNDAKMSNSSYSKH